MRWTGHVIWIGEMKYVYKILFGKRPLVRPWCRYVDDIATNHWEMGWKGVGWMHLTENRDWWWALVNTVMNLQVP
jgi:hypothetical protein